MDKFSYHAVLSFLAVLSLCYLAFSFYALGDKPWILYNSDNGIPFLYQYIVTQGGHFKQFEFAAVTYFFPEVATFFAVATIIKPIKLAMLLFGVLQLLCYYWLMIAIGKQLVSSEEKLSLFRLSTLTSLFLLSAGYFTHKEIFESALTSWLHFGSTLMFLVGLWLILRIYSANKTDRHCETMKWSKQSRKLSWIATALSAPRNDMFLLFCICFLTTFSDLLYITQFSLPAIVTLAMMLAIDKKNTTTHSKLLIVIGAATLLAYLMYHSNVLDLYIYQANHIVKRFHPHELGAAVKKIIKVFRDFYQPNAIIIFLFVIYLFITTNYLSNIFNKKTGMVDSTAITFTLLMLFNATLIGFLSSIFLDNDLMVYSYVGMRHYQPFILFTVFIGIPIYLFKYTNASAITHKHYFLLLFILILCANLFTPKGSVKKLIAFYPPSVACLDQYAAQYHLQNGVANYWEARAYQSLSTQHLNLVAVTSQMQPYLFTSTKEQYKNKDFNFVIAQDERTLSPSYPPGYYPDFYWNEAKLQQRLGKPIKVLECPSPLADGHEKIYIYKSGVINAQWNKA